MDKKTAPKGTLIVEGLAGHKTLHGEVFVNGAKNAALKAMAAAVLFDGEVELRNIPDTEDVGTMVQVLRKLGATVIFSSGNKSGDVHDHPSSDGSDQSRGLVLKINTTPVHSTTIDGELAKAMRSSVVLTGPLLARYGEVTFPSPGGCVIGARPIDLFLNGYKSLGADVDGNDHAYVIKSSSALKGSVISFDKVSVGATETLMMSAVLAKGVTVLENCAVEPEIVNVAEWLNSCGARISGVGTKTMTIHGTSRKLLLPKKPYVAIPDRIEAGSYLIMGALCARDLLIKNCRPDHLSIVIESLRRSGVPIEVGEDAGIGFLKIANNTEPNSSFKAFNIDTREYPGFVTDLQAPAVVFQTQASGRSTVVENIFEGRFKYVPDLIKLGANISIRGERTVDIAGPTRLVAPSLPASQYCELTAHDIRAGFAIVLACLVAEGKFRITNTHLIDRGYERLEVSLARLGAKISRA